MFCSFSAWETALKPGQEGEKALESEGCKTWFCFRRSYLYLKVLIMIDLLGIGLLKQSVSGDFEKMLLRNLHPREADAFGRKMIQKGSI